MKLGIIGVGVVGSAVQKAFQDKFELACYDKFRSEYQESFQSVLETDAVFICVPTLTNKDYSQDLEPFKDVIGALQQHGYKGVIVNKCTVAPGTTKLFHGIFPSLRLVHYPEFLTEANAYDDFINQKTILLGGKNEDCEILTSVFLALNPEMKFEIYEDPTATELIKYTHNCFHSVKVEFFNEVYDLAQKFEIDYNSMIEGLLTVSQVGRSHTRVPGPDGKRGFGGMCFPKDMKALAYKAREIQVPVPLIEIAIVQNKTRRDDA